MNESILIFMSDLQFRRKFQRNILILKKIDESDKIRTVTQLAL